MGTYQEQIEQAHKRQQVADIRRASQLGLTPPEFKAQRKRMVEEWSAKIRGLMDQCGARDPVEVLPEIVTLMLEDLRGVAREEAQQAAKGMVQKMLKRCMVAP
jgi:hypothetical protein